MFVDKAFLAVAAVAGLFLALASTELVRTLPQTEAGLDMYERSCPAYTAAAGVHAAR